MFLFSYYFNISICRVFRHTSRPRSPLLVSSAPPTPFRTMEQEGRFDDPRYLPNPGPSHVKNKPESGLISDVSVNEMHQYLTVLVEASKKAFKLVQRSSDPKISKKAFWLKPYPTKFSYYPTDPMTSGSERAVNCWVNFSPYSPFTIEMRTVGLG